MMTSKNKAKIVNNDPGGIILASTLIHPDIMSRHRELTDGKSIEASARNLEQFSDKIDRLDRMTSMFDADNLSKVPAAPVSAAPVAAAVAAAAAAGDESVEEGPLTIGGLEDLGDEEDQLAASGDDQDVSVEDIFAELMTDQDGEPPVFGRDSLADEPDDIASGEDDLPDFESIDHETALRNAEVSGRIMELEDIATLPVDLVEDFSAEGFPAGDNEYAGDEAGDWPDFDGDDAMGEDVMAEEDDGAAVSLPPADMADLAPQEETNLADILPVRGQASQDDELAAVSSFDDDFFGEEDPAEQEDRISHDAVDPEENLDWDEVADPTEKVDPTIMADGWQFDTPGDADADAEDGFDLPRIDPEDEFDLPAVSVDTGQSGVPFFDLSRDNDGLEEHDAPSVELPPLPAAPAPRNGVFGLKLFGKAKNARQAPEEEVEPEIDITVNDFDGDLKVTIESDTDELVPAGDAEEVETDTAAPKRRSAGLLAASLMVVGIAVGTGYIVAGPFFKSDPAPITVVSGSASTDMEAPSPTQVPVETVEGQIDPDGSITPEDGSLGDLRQSEGSAAPEAIPLQDAEDDRLDRIAAGLEAASDGDLGDLFQTAPTEALVSDAVKIETMLAEYARSADLEAMKVAVDALVADAGKYDTEIAGRDEQIAGLQGELSAAKAQAERAEQLALAQNEILVDLVRVKEKVDMAESLIVDLSRRVASVEMTDPADRVAVERSLVDLDGRLKGLARDVGLVARVAINGSAAAVPGAAAGRAAAVGGGNPVFAEGGSTDVPARSKASIPASVKKDDFVEGYGYVLDIIPTSDGSRLVVMENASVLID